MLSRGFSFSCMSDGNGQNQARKETHGHKIGTINASKSQRVKAEKTARSKTITTIKNKTVPRMFEVDPVPGLPESLLL